MLIYLDICCFNRLFDDQTRLLVRLQIEAKLHVQEMIRRGDYKLAWSAVIDLENNANPDADRRRAIVAGKVWPVSTYLPAQKKRLWPSNFLAKV